MEKGEYIKRIEGKKEHATVFQEFTKEQLYSEIERTKRVLSELLNPDNKSEMNFKHDTLETESGVNTEVYMKKLKELEQERDRRTLLN